MRLITASLVILLSAVPAFACLNDTKTSAVENEFRSAYNHATTAVEKTGNFPWGIIALGAGVGLILGSAVALVLRK